jgi:hypothetical protein
MPTLPQIIQKLWGTHRAVQVVNEYHQAFLGHELVMRDLALFCNAASPIEGATDFDRGVEEGKRRVWLHISRVCGLNHTDFVPIADGTKEIE